ncbi:hypothetical protein AXG93_4666s1090 [Marchantia polymorpha subsp. ruderalis]|uniref:Small ribosomal subunit protein eS1 n=1 Tax=Marchantia polymorpha subsp. ruderalis TaxID=1480154 RepID=A0A176W283_MARPO|nr:hypothetical protein AXG93_4666s1090 [Marchantia polymorpha subsp. ruderalis]
MAVGKNKRISKGKKGGKKKIVDPFSKKDWYDIKAPSTFSQRQVGKTLVTRTQGTKIASDGLKGRVFEISLADLQQDEDQAFRKIKLRAEDVQGKNVLTNFWGMDFTTDKLRSLVRKWQSLIEAHVDVKTTDNYTLRMFCIGFTKKRPNQIKRTCYAQSSQIRQIRKKMREIMVMQAQSCDLKDLVAKFIPEVIGKEIEKATAGIYPLQNTFVRKVKILKAPKFDLSKLMEVHGDYSEEVGAKIERPVGDDAEPEAEAVEVVVVMICPTPSISDTGERRGLRIALNPNSSLGGFMPITLSLSGPRKVLLGRKREQPVYIVLYTLSSSLLRSDFGSGACGRASGVTSLTSCNRSLSVTYSKMELDYWGKHVLAPMVRVGTIPLRMLAAEYGADITYGEELVDHKFVKCYRQENEELQTVDFIEKDTKEVVFRTSSLEKHRVVFQIGTADALRALKVAQQNDVAAIDINMGCPKSFSLSGGMGAALLSKPDLIHDILTTLKRNLNIPVTCKIRLLKTYADTVELARRIESTGVSAIGVHGRRVADRPRDPAQWDGIAEVVSALSIPVIANGDVFEYEDFQRIKDATGAASVMVARAACWNVSVFRPGGKLPWEDVKKEYIKKSILWDNDIKSTKHELKEMIMHYSCLEFAEGKLLNKCKDIADVSDMYGVRSYYDEVQGLRNKRRHASFAGRAFGLLRLRC